MQRKSFQFKREYYEALKRFSPSKRLAVYEAIARYALYGELTELTGQAAAAFYIVRPIIDTEIRQSIEGRRSAEYKAWRAAVFARDEFTCRVCGERGGRLNAHHIKKYSVFPELRYDISNGITLCEGCHKEVHRREREVYLNAE